MANLIQAAKDQVAALTQQAYEKAAQGGQLPGGLEVKGSVEIPKDVSHGDYASSFAMAGAKAMRMAPGPSPRSSATTWSWREPSFKVRRSPAPVF